jgi:enoyl-CoA hydratase
MNAVIEQMYQDLQKVLTVAESDHEVRTLILTGSVWHRPQGDKQAFCAGADLKKHASGQRTPFEKREYILLAHETTRRIYEFPKPIIAAINGPARGAGSEMAVNCDFIIMADTATIGFPETGLGTFVGGGVTYHLPRIIGLAKTKELVYTGRMLSGPEAVEIGLAFCSTPVENLMKEAMDLAGLLAGKAPISMAFAKNQIQKALIRDLDTALLVEAEAILACMNTEDWQEGVDSFAEKRPPVYKGK